MSADNALAIYVLTSSLSLGNDGSKLYFKTNKDAPLYRIIAIDVSDSSLKRETIVEMQKDAILDSAALVHKTYFALVHKRNVG